MSWGEIYVRLPARFYLFYFILKTLSSFQVASIRIQLLDAFNTIQSRA